MNINAKMLQKFQDVSSFRELLDIIKEYGQENDAMSIYEMLPAMYEKEEQLLENWFQGLGRYQCTVIYTRRLGGFDQELQLVIDDRYRQRFTARFSISSSGAGIVFRQCGRQDSPSGRVI